MYNTTTTWTLIMLIVAITTVICALSMFYNFFRTLITKERKPLKRTYFAISICYVFYAINNIMIGHKGSAIIDIIFSVLFMFYYYSATIREKKENETTTKNNSGE